MLGEVTHFFVGISQYLADLHIIKIIQIDRWVDAKLANCFHKDQLKK